jgi:hypothetical protein
LYRHLGGRYFGINGMTRLRQVTGALLFPVIFAAFVPLNLFAVNIGTFDVSETIRAFVLSIFVVAFIQWLAVKIFGNARVSSIILGYLLFGVWSLNLGSVWWLIYASGFVIIIACLWRWPVGEKAIIVLNMVAIAIFLTPVAAITSHYWSQKTIQESQFGAGPFHQLSRRVDDRPPSIVHIVLDGYSSDETLRRIYRFDNSSFFDALRDQGFIVFPNINAAYNQTLLSMASIFHGEYLNSAQAPLTLQGASEIRRLLAAAVSDGPILRRLAADGYQFFHTKNGYSGIRFSGTNKASLPDGILSPLNLFESYMIQTTGLRLVMPVETLQSHVLDNLLRHGLNTDVYRGQEGPIYYYHHLLSPHPPHTINRLGETIYKEGASFATIADGDPTVAGNPALQAEYQAGYVEKLRYTNAALVKQTKEMIAGIAGNKVILIHGDHGGGSLWHPDDMSKSCLAERLGTFLAVYADDPAILSAFKRNLQVSPNLINLYRTLFGELYGKKFQPLPDKSYFADYTTVKNLRLVDRRVLTRNCGY